jgi:hypothetical protein
MSLALGRPQPKAQIEKCVSGFATRATSWRVRVKKLLTSADVFDRLWPSTSSIAGDPDASPRKADAAVVSDHSPAARRRTPPVELPARAPRFSASYSGSGMTPDFAA